MRRQARSTLSGKRNLKRRVLILNEALPDFSLFTAGGGGRHAGSYRTGAADAREVLGGFIDRTNRVSQLVEVFMPECSWLDDEATQTYLHSTISTRRHRVRVPEIPMYLNALLA